MRFRLHFELLRCRLADRLAALVSSERVVSPPEGVKVNLGCGGQYLEEWINIDTDPLVKADLAADFRSLPEHFSASSLAVVQLIHSVSYLRYWEARDFFRDVHNLLQVGGVMILEFPDIEKCARRVRLCRGVPDFYLEAVRAIYAFDLDQNRRRDSYVPYHFGWSAWHVKEELCQAGFSQVHVLRPQTHGQLSWRDTRIEAVK